MKQRIRVVGLVQNGGSVLIMKKNVGRSENAPTWELPTGKLKFGEQPEEAIDRTLEEYLGVEETEKIELLDVVTFLAPQGSSQLSNLYIIYKVSLSEGVKIRPAERYTAYKYIKPEEIGNYRLDEASASVLAMEGQVPARTSFKEVANRARV